MDVAAGAVAGQTLSFVQVFPIKSQSLCGSERCTNDEHNRTREMYQNVIPYLPCVPVTILPPEQAPP